MQWILHYRATTSYSEERGNRRTFNETISVSGSFPVTTQATDQDEALAEISTRTRLSYSQADYREQVRILVDGVVMDFFSYPSGCSIDAPTDIKRSEIDFDNVVFRLVDDEDTGEE